MTINIYPAIVHDNDLSPDHGGAHIDELCQEIRDATKGFGANRQKVIDALATQDATTRTYMAIRYKELFGKNMDELMKSEFSGDLGKALEFLSLRPDRAEVKMIRRATQGIGANANIVWSIVCGRTNDEIERLKKTYFEMYSKDLGKLLGSELHGDLERLVFTALQGAEEPYDPQFHTLDKAKQDADTIHKKGQGRFFGTEERGIFKIICFSPKEHLENISNAYAEKYGYTLLKAMEKELSGNAKDACLFLIGMKLKPYETMAGLIKAACAGFGTDELLLTCCIIRFQPMLAEVQSAHIELYGKTIHDRVREEVGGKYQAVLLQILNTVWPEQG